MRQLLAGGDGAQPEAGHVAVPEMRQRADAGAGRAPLVSDGQQLVADVPGQMAIWTAVLGRDAPGERHLQEQPRVPSAPEECFEALGTLGDVIR